MPNGSGEEGEIVKNLQTDGQNETDRQMDSQMTDNRWSDKLN